MNILRYIYIIKVIGTITIVLTLFNIFLFTWFLIKNKPTQVVITNSYYETLDTCINKDTMLIDSIYELKR